MSSEVGQTGGDMAEASPMVVVMQQGSTSMLSSSSAAKELVPAEA
jgi:hypothetical protein